jgi:hypothetical protein
MNTTYFVECVLRPLTEFCYPHGRETDEKGVILHFDNVPIHNTSAVQKSLVNFGFRRMEHPPDRPDLAPCNFFLFGAMKQAFSGQYFDTIDDFFMDVEAFMGGLSADFFQTVFKNGQGDCSYAVKAAENTLNERYKIGHLLL